MGLRRRVYVCIATLSTTILKKFHIYGHLDVVVGLILRGTSGFCTRGISKNLNTIGLYDRRAATAFSTIDSKGLSKLLFLDFNL